MTMKAVQFQKPGGSSVLEVVDLPVPRVEQGKVLVRVHAVGLNKIEGMIRAGFIPLPPPVVLGSDAAGIVEESGDSHFKKGDRVAIFQKDFSPRGTYAQFFLADGNMLTKIPDNIGFPEATTFGIPFMTAYYNVVINLNVQAGEVLLVNGASGQVGLYALEIAKALGAKTIGVAGNPEGLQLIARRGAAAISYKDGDFLQKVRDAAGAGGVNAILETQSKNIPKDLEYIARQGRIVLIGNPDKAEINFMNVLMKEVTIRGTNCNSATPDQFKQMKQGLEKAIKEGWIHPQVEKIYPLNDVRKAHDDLENAHGTAGKLVLDMTH